MKRLVLVAFASVVLIVVADANGSGSRLLHVVKSDGPLIATLTYRVSPGGITHRPLLSVRRNGRLVLAHRMCPLDWGRNAACRWGGPDTWYFTNHGPGVFRNLSGGGSPAVVIDLYLGGAHCCVQSFIALTGSKPVWIAHDWKNPGYHGKEIGGHYYFVSGDNRFDYAFTAYAFSWAPIQVWTIRDGRLVDVTRNVPSLVAADAKRAWRAYLGRWGRRNREFRGIGPLAGWCADRYLLARGADCKRMLHKELVAGYLNARQAVGGRKFIRVLNRDLVRWDYTR